MSTRRRRMCATAIAATALLVAACGDDDDAASTSEGSATSASPTAAATSAPATDPRPDDTDRAVAATSGAAAVGAFPVTIEHKFGSTTIDERPERIVSVGYHEQDFLASLGAPPVMARVWMADIVNPWSEEAFGDAAPESFEGLEIPFEAIAAADPDLIVGVFSGIDENDYELLSDIAPTLAQTDEAVHGQMSWQDQLSMVGDAIGEDDQARQQIDELEARFTSERDAHPDWEGLRLGIVTADEGEFGAYASGDARMRFFADLGFDTTALDHLADEGSAWITFSHERVDELADLDVVVWYGPEGDVQSLTEHLDFHTSGSEIWMEGGNLELFGFQTNLSIGGSLDLLVPELELATDGDPSTVVPTAAEAGTAPET